MPRDQLPEIRPFLQRIDGFIDLTGSLPWLRDVMKRNTEMSVQLRFVGERSFSLSAAASMIGDMRTNGMEDLASVVEKRAADCAFLEVDYAGSSSRWVILPDRRSILWHFNGKPLDFVLSDFRMWDYQGWHSVGALVLPDGELRKP
jgi:hypothetical protein